MATCSKKRAVRFLSEGGTFGWTSRKAADKDVRRGRARWLSTGVLEYIATDRRVIAASLSAVKSRQYVNGDGFATFDAIAHLPCIRPIELITGKRPAHPPRDYPTVELSRKLLPL